MAYGQAVIRRSTGLRPGWLVALSAAVLAVSVWLPWLTTSAGGGGRANAIGGTHGSLELPAQFGPGQLIVLLASALLVAGAMAGRGISPRWAAVAGLLISAGAAALTAWYYRHYIAHDVVAGFGLYIAVGAAVAAGLFSLWALIHAVRAGRSGR